MCVFISSPNTCHSLFIIIATLSRERCRTYVAISEGERCTPHETCGAISVVCLLLLSSSLHWRSHFAATIQTLVQEDVLNMQLQNSRDYHGCTQGSLSCNCFSRPRPYSKQSGKRILTCLLQVEDGPYHIAVPYSSTAQKWGSGVVF